MLLIDDEADNASVNTKKDETDPTKQISSYAKYVAYSKIQLMWGLQQRHSQMFS